MSYFSKKISEWRESAWLLGICENGFDDLKAGNIRWIDNGVYKGKKWFADPFILDYDNKTIHLFVEEFDYKVHRGRIAKLTIDRVQWLVTDCKIILDLSTHLSFPMIFREGGEVLVCPENYHSGGWNMYRYNATTEHLDYLCQISDMKLTDATMWKNEGVYWLLSTYAPKPNGPELTIWQSKIIDGPFEEIQRVKFEENLGRNAGMIFKYGDKYIRPAQESNHVYGHSMSFQEVSLVNGIYGFKEVYRFYTPHHIYDSGSHTYNQYEEMAVIDVKGFRHPIAGRFFRLLSWLMVKLHLKKQYTFV